MIRFRVICWFCAFLSIAALACKPKSQQPPANPMTVPQPPPERWVTTAEASAPVPDKPPNPHGNMLKNPGFEEGRANWFYLDWSKNWIDFEITGKKAHSGKNSAYLKIDAGADVTDAQVHGLVQTLTPNRFPEKATGWYRVENWTRGCPKQYIQFVVIVWGGHPEYKNYQIRYILAGTKEPPYNMVNVKYLFAPGVSDEPIQDKWTQFEFPILEDFKKQWNIAPKGYEKINFFCETRFDMAIEKDRRARADVYFDDLYIGD